ncbi:sugar transferase [Bifidobacterium pullorum]|uniref:sugar transferase n=1 Tax=Bifidobacterium pullorum TaxID=78448 RepID=UPI00307BEB04
MLVKPGITGPWQVSGRSNLSKEESESLDVSYVQNWSMLGDIVLLFRTVGAVVTIRVHTDRRNEDVTK